MRAGRRTIGEMTRPLDMAVRGTGGSVGATIVVTREGCNLRSDVAILVLRDILTGMHTKGTAMTTVRFRRCGKRLLGGKWASRATCIKHELGEFLWDYVYGGKQCETPHGYEGRERQEKV